MVLDYAKTKSDATVLREGGNDELEAHKRRRLAEKGTSQISSFSEILIHDVSLQPDFADYILLVLQSGNKLTRPSKPRRSSSAPPLLRRGLAQPRRQRVPASSPPPVPQLQSCRMSTYPPTKFCSCGISPTMPARRVCPRSLAGSRASRKSDWCPAARVLRSSSTKPRPVPSVPRRLLRVWPWATRTSPFALHTRDNRRCYHRHSNEENIRCISGFFPFFLWRRGWVERAVQLIFTFLQIKYLSNLAVVGLKHFQCSQMIFPDKPNRPTRLARPALNMVQVK